MIAECMDGNIDMVITKSISRFARNTLDCLQYIRQLKDKNISVYFEKENINTMDAKGEVLLTIMASLAQQESQSLSQNVKLGLQYRYQQGKVQVNHKRFMGYTKDEDGNLIIVPEEAEIIKRIYREYLEGQSLVGIGRGLEKDGILTAAGKPRWRPESVKKILQNEKYIGDALLQKTVTVDFLTKKRVKNEGHVPQYYVENSHEAIIPKELYLQVQEEIHRRSNIYTGEGKNKRIYSSKYALSAITFCGDCGDIYRRTYWNIHGRKEFVWRCVTRIEQGPEVCKNRTVKEDELYGAVMTAINKLLAGGNNMIKPLEENIHAVIGETTEYQISEINNLLEEKQKELIKLANKGQDYEHLAICSHFIGIDKLERLKLLQNDPLVNEFDISVKEPETVSRFLGNFNFKTTQMFRDINFKVFKKLLTKSKLTSITIDIDSSVINVEGHQEGASKGYNPKKLGNRCYNIQFAFCDELKAYVTGFVRSGNTYTANGASEMIKEIVANIKTDDLEILFRMDSGYFDEKIIETIESLGCKYLIKAKSYSTLTSQATNSSIVFVKGEEGRETTELFTKLDNWEKDRRFVVSRVLKPEKERAQISLLEGSEYEYFFFVKK